LDSRAEYLYRILADVNDEEEKSDPAHASRMIYCSRQHSLSSTSDCDVLIVGPFHLGDAANRQAVVHLIFSGEKLANAIMVD
jgi:hypothetical protein